MGGGVELKTLYAEYAFVNGWYPEATSRTSNAIIVLGAVVSSSWAGLATLSVPNWGLSGAGLAFLSGAVE